MASDDTDEDLSDLAQRQLSLFENSSYGDYTIRCRGRAFNVHRNIVCPQSAILQVLCNGDWKEGETNEARLDEHDPEVVEQVLRYLYSSRYDDRVRTALLRPDEEAKAEGLRAALLFNVKVYILADYLGINSLGYDSTSVCADILNNPPKPLNLLSEAVDLTLSNTRPDDEYLRPCIMRSLAKVSDEIDQLPEPELLHAIAAAEPLAWRILKDAQVEVKRLEVEILVLRAQMETSVRQAISKGELEKQKVLAQATNFKYQAVQYEEALASVLDALGLDLLCRNQTCRQPLKVYAMAGEKGILRCTSCLCKHYMKL